MKHLDEFFVPYDSLFETNILLTSMSSVLNVFVSEIYALSTHSYTG